jgi:TetR/AcrR family transcriptional regulator
LAATGSKSVSDSRREQRRVRQQDLSRNHFLDAAEEVFGRKGFHDTTLKEVAEVAEYSVGSVYTFFENKEDLFRQIFVRRGEEFMPQLHGILDVDGSPRDQLNQLVDFEVGYFRQHPHFGRLYLTTSSAAMLSTDRDVDEVMSTNFNEAMALQADLIARGQAAGVFRSGDPLVLARLFSGIVAAYQAMDPAVVSDVPDPTERFPLSELQGLVAAAFVVA